MRLMWYDGEDVTECQYHEGRKADHREDGKDNDQQVGAHVHMRLMWYDGEDVTECQYHEGRMADHREDGRTMTSKLELAQPTRK